MENDTVEIKLDSVLSKPNVEFEPTPFDYWFLDLLKDMVFHPRPEKVKGYSSRSIKTAEGNHRSFPYFKDRFTGVA